MRLRLLAGGERATLAPPIHPHPHRPEAATPLSHGSFPVSQFHHTSFMSVECCIWCICLIRLPKGNDQTTNAATHGDRPPCRICARTVNPRGWSTMPHRKEIDFFLTAPDTPPLAGTLRLGTGGDMTITCYDPPTSLDAIVLPPSTPVSSLVTILAERMADRARSPRNSAKASTASTSSSGSHA